MKFKWLQPTLTRRVIGALLVAFTLFGIAALVQDQLDIQRQMKEEPGVRPVAWQVAAALRDVDDERQAAHVVAGLASFANTGRHRTPLLPGDLLFQLYDAEGRRVFSSTEAAPAIEAVGLGEQSLLGRNHWTYRHDQGRWSVRIGEPVIASTALLGFASWELAKVLLWGFPLMLLPLWVAVRTGLSPLRRFAHRLQVLDPRDDLAPLGADLRYGELRPVGQAFDALLQRLRQRRARERAFVHEAAHELRTPLAVVATQAHALVQASDDAARATAAAALQQAIARSAHLSRQLLDLASLDNEQAAEPAALDLAHFCAERLTEQARVARERGVALALEAPEHLPALVDAIALHSVLQNLLDNALRYAGRGSRVEVQLAVAPEGLRLAVADDGPGIAAADRPLVFERFWRGAGHDVTGSGLGLAIVARAAERLGGRVSVSDGLPRAGGCGARFELQLPATVLGVS